MRHEDRQRLEDALFAIPAWCDRETWVKIGMALKHALGSDGEDLWHRWSEQDRDGYVRKDAQAVWKSCKGHGGITVGTLFHEAQRHGWEGKVDEEARERFKQEATRRALQVEAADAETARKQREAAQRAVRIVAGCSRATHGYLIDRGLPNHAGLVDADGGLIVPIFAADQQDRYMQSVQRITSDGTKKMLRDGRARLGVLKIGPPKPDGVVLLEGYATGLSSRQGLDRIGMKMQNVAVWVCFSAGNIPFVARHLPRGVPAVVLTDNDLSRAGAFFSQRSGLAWWEPPRPADWPADKKSFDGNDFARKHGPRRLGEALEWLLKRAAQPGPAVRPGDPAPAPWEPVAANSAPPDSKVA